MSDHLVLAADIGGTKSNIGLYTGSPMVPIPVIESTYQNRNFASLTDAIRQFHRETGRLPSQACLAVAGAIVNGESTLPNLGWHITETVLREELGFASVRLINDLEATAHGLPILTKEQIIRINDGELEAEGNRALIAAGTGLGMAIMLPDKEGWRVVSSEGGHVDFAPRTEREEALRRFLAKRFDHVSVERVVSGQGIVNIYDFLKQSGFDEPEWLSSRHATASDIAASIAQAGMSKEADICVETLELFLSAYGAVTGNLALTILATGGVYVGGGIAPKLIEAFPYSGFMATFRDKGRFARLLGKIPVSIIMEPRCALYGAAVCALRNDAKT